MAENDTDNSLQVPTTVAAAVEAPKPAEAAVKKGPDKAGFYWGLGRRKSAVARVRIRPGDGKVMVNKKELTDFFPREVDQKAVVAPLKMVEAEKTIDVFVNVKGGGSTGQAGATVMGIARALGKYDDSFLPQLRDSGYLTRDSRMVERKKPGQKGARKRFQFSKR